MKILGLNSAGKQAITDRSFAIIAAAITAVFMAFVVLMAPARAAVPDYIAKAIKRCHRHHGVGRLADQGRAYYCHWPPKVNR